MQHFNVWSQAAIDRSGCTVEDITSDIFKCSFSRFRHLSIIQRHNAIILNCLHIMHNAMLCVRVYIIMWNEKQGAMFRAEFRIWTKQKPEVLLCLGLCFCQSEETWLLMWWDHVAQVDFKWHWDFTIKLNIHMPLPTSVTPATKLYISQSWPYHDL